MLFVFPDQLLFPSKTTVFISFWLETNFFWSGLPVAKHFPTAMLLMREGWCFSSHTSVCFPSWRIHLISFVLIVPYRVSLNCWSLLVEKCFKKVESSVIVKDGSSESDGSEESWSRRRSRNVDLWKRKKTSVRLFVVETIPWII